MITTLPHEHATATPSNPWVWSVLLLGLVGFAAIATATLNLVLA